MGHRQFTIIPIINIVSLYYSDGSMIIILIKTVTTNVVIQGYCHKAGVRPLSTTSKAGSS